MRNYRWIALALLPLMLIAAAAAMAERIVLERDGAGGRWRVVDPTSSPPSTRPNTPDPATQPAPDPLAPHRPLPVPTVRLGPGDRLLAGHLDDAGAVVELAAGAVYDGPITIKGKGLVLLSDPANPATVRAGGAGTWTNVVDVKADDVWVYGVRVDQVDPGRESRGFYARGDGIVIERCDWTDRITQFAASTGEDLAERLWIRNNRGTAVLGGAMPAGKTAGYLFWGSKGTAHLRVTGNVATSDGFSVRVHGLGGDARTNVITGNHFTSRNRPRPGKDPTWRGLAPRGVLEGITIEDNLLDGDVALNIGNKDALEPCRGVIFRNNRIVGLRHISLSGDTAGLVFEANAIEAPLAHSNQVDLDTVGGVAPTGRVAHNAWSTPATRLFNRTPAAGLVAEGNTNAGVPFNR